MPNDASGLTRKVVNDGLWHQVSFTFDHGTALSYADGALDTSASYPGTDMVYSSNIPFRIGEDVYNQNFIGSIGEARLLTVARSAGWISTEYASQNTPATFATLGNVEGTAINQSWLSGWSGRKKVTISHAKVDANLSNFPLLVRFSGNTDLAGALSSGNDIRFTASDGTTVLPYEKETWTGGGGASASGVFWVKVPTISHTADTDIYVYYGNASASDGQQKTAVWDSNYKGVWHLNDPTNPTDSTSNGNDGTNHGTTLGSGPFGAGAANFDGISGNVTTPLSLNGDTAFTMSSWVKKTSSGSQMTFGVGAGASDTSRAELVFYTDSILYGAVGPDENTWGRQAVPTNYTNWHLITFAYNGSGSTNADKVSLYVDGAPLSSLGFNGTIGSSVNTSDGFLIGHRNTGYSNGLMAETHVSNTTRSAAWIKFEYANQTGTNQLSIEGYTATTPGQIVWTDGSGDGKWSTAGNWQGGVVPGTSDTAVFNSSASGNASIDANESVKGIEIDYGYTGTVTQSGGNTLTLGSAGFVQAGGTFVGGSGAITDAGDFSETGGAFTSTSGTLSVAGAFTHSGGTWAANAGTVLLTNTSDKALTISASTPFANLNLNDGLVGYWKMDETSGTLVHDASGYGNDGTNHGAAISSDVPVTNFTDAKSLSFDGSSGKYVETANASIYNFEYNNPFTLSSWVKSTDTTSDRFIVAKELNSSTYTGYYDFIGNGGRDISGGKVGFILQSYANAIEVYGSTNVRDGNWHHVVSMSDGSGRASGMSIYVDGRLENITIVKDNLAGNSIRNDSPLNIGSRQNGGVPFKGNIDDVRIYNRALSSGEIAALSAGNEPGTSVATTTVTGGNLSVAGNLTLNSGTLNTGTHDISFGGNWMNNGGIFAPNSQTVTLDGTDQSLNSSNSFYNLAKSVSSAAVLTFGQGSTQTIAHTLSLSGASGQLLSLRSSTDGTQWKINPQGTRTLSYLDVKDSNNTNGTAMATAGQNTTDSGNNTNWTFDVTAPIVTVTAPAASSVSGASVNFSASATDETSLGFLVPNLDHTLVSWWKGDVTGGGTTVADSIGSNTGTVHGGVTEVSGKFGKGMSFNGTDGYVSGNLYTTSSATPFSVSAWVNTDSLGSWPVAFAWGPGSNGATVDIAVGATSGTAQTISCDKYIGSQSPYAFSINLHQWYHVSCVYDGSSMSEYINGVYQGRWSGPIAISGSNYSVGMGLGAGYFHGSIDDTMIFNRALTADEVRALYDGTAISHTSTLTGGAHTYTAYAEDLAGNVGSTTSTFSLDTVAPSTSDDYGAKAGVWQNASQTITLTPADASPSSGIAWTKYCQDQTPLTPCDPSIGTTLNAPYHITISTEGTSYLRYVSEDNEGNVQDPVSVQVKIDTTGPTTTATAGSYNFGDWTNVDVTVSLSCLDVSSGCATTYYCDDSPTCTDYSTYSSPVTISATGTSHIRYYSLDAQGNTETVTSQAVNIDKTGPSVGAGDNQTKNAQFTQTATVTAGTSPIASKLWTMVSGPGTITFGTPTQTSTTVSASQDGAYVIRITATDTAHNSHSASFNLTWDTTGPILTETAPVQTPSTITAPVYTFTSNKAGDISYQGSCLSTTTTAIAGSNQITFNALSPATYSDCVITVTDSLGNVSLPLSVTPFTITVPSSGGGGVGLLANQKSNIASQVAEQIVNQITNLFVPQPPQVKYPPINIPKETPNALKDLKIMSVNPLGNFDLTPVATDISSLTQRLPQLKKTLDALGINVNNPKNVEKLSQTQLYLPGLTQTISGIGFSANQVAQSGQNNISGVGLPAQNGKGTQSPESLQANALAMVSGIPLADLSAGALAKIPTNLVFARTAGGLVDFVSSLAVDKTGNTTQTIKTISGKPMELVIRPENPALRVTGLITLRTLAKADNSKPIENLFAAALSAVAETPATSQSSGTAGLLLQKFDYKEVKPGVFQAEVNAPSAEGQYEIDTIVEYKDANISPTESKLTAVVDPEGYVYEQVSGGKLRIQSAVVSMYWLNPASKKFEIWPADKFMQKNPIITDDTGKYSFLVPQGTYYLTATAPKYRDYKGASFNIIQDNGITIDIQMKKNTILPDWLNLGAVVVVLLVVVIILLAVIILKKKK